MEALVANIPDVLTFEPVSFKDIFLIDHILCRYCCPSCDYSIGGILIWKDYYSYEYSIIQDTLFLRGTDPDTGCRLYYQPIGGMSYDTAMRLIRECMSGEDAYIVEWDEDWISTGIGLNRRVNSILRPDLDDYVYEISQFTHFQGKKMEKKRNHFNYFNNHYADCEIAELSESDLNEVIEFTRSLDMMHEQNALFLYENRHCTDLIPYMGQSGLFGVVIRRQGELIGYAYGEVIGNMFYAHVEKGDVEYRGIYQKLASEMAQRAEWRGALYVNREDDAGNNYLRKSKESYHPVMMVRKRLCR